MDDELFILWTNADEITFDKMVYMYSRNSLLKGWWKKATVIIWGHTALLTAESPLVQARIEEARHAGVHFSACIACADQLGVSEKLKEQGIELKAWGESLTDLLKRGARVLSV